MSYILASSKPVIKPATDYEKLKTKLRNTTTGYGTAIVTSYFVTQGAAEVFQRLWVLHLRLRIWEL